MSRDARKQVFVVPEQVGHIAACIFPERVILAIMYTDHTYIAKQKAPISCAATAQSICAPDFAYTENLCSQDAAKFKPISLTCDF